MLTLTITDEKLQQTFDNALEAMLVPGNYDNPVKRSLDNLLGYSGSMRKELEEQIKEMMQKVMQTPEFATAVGNAMATELAKRELDRLKK